MNDELYTLLSDLAEEQSELAIRQAHIDVLRARISELVEAQGGKVSIAGVGRAEIRAPVVLTVYDKDRLDELAQSLSESGYASIADEIRQCVKRSARAGGLSITFERKARA